MHLWGTLQAEGLVCAKALWQERASVAQEWSHDGSGWSREDMEGVGVLCKVQESEGLLKQEQDMNFFQVHAGVM